MSTDASMHHCIKAVHTELEGVENDAMKFLDSDINILTIFAAPHVCAATVAAFNEAMAKREEEEAAW